MSYIHKREKVFSKKGGLSLLAALKFKTPGRLKNVNSFTDPRAWSLDRNSQRKYFLDSIAINTYNGSSSSSDECLEYTPPKKRRNSAATKMPKRELQARRAISAEQLKCIKPQPDRPEVKLAEANAEINLLNSQKEELEIASKEYQMETDNLRTLLTEMQDELSFLNGLKDENINLRAELQADIHKQVSDAEEEINHLNSQLEIYKEYKFKYEDLRSCNEQLRDEHDQIRLLLKEMEWNNTQLQNEIESLKMKVGTLESRELAISNATVDKEVLRERLLMREEKIVSLVSFLEEKEMTIQELVVQLQRLTSSVVAKDSATGKHINALKLALNEKMIKIEELEDRLHASELFIRELENIRDHFRLSNCALTENMQNYKKQFNTIVSCSKKLLSQLEICKLDIEDKELLIRKLSIFPQSASSIVHFAQLLNILKSTEEMINTDNEGAISFIPTMRRIVEQLKGEIIGDRIEYPLYEIHDSESQTDFKGSDKSIQNELFYIEHKSVEVCLPDRYFFAYEKSQTEIAELNTIIAALKESFLRVDSANHSLERKVITFLAERSAKEMEINSLREQLASLNEEMKHLRIEVDRNYSLLNKSLHEIDIEKELRESTSEMFVATLDSTTYEYNMYVKVLESLLKHKDEKINCLEDYLCQEPQKEETVENEHITLLENELKHISSKYVKEKQNVKTLNVQVSKLQAALSEKMDHFKIVQEKLLRAEKIFEHLNNIESQCILKGNHQEEFAVLPTEEIVVTASDKILSHSEMLESHLKEEKNIKEKLLRDTVSREYVSNLMQRNTSQKRNLKKTIIQLKNNICRVKFALSKLRNKLKLSERNNRQYSAEISKLETHSLELKKEVDYMKDQLQMEKSKNKNLEIALEMKTMEQYNQRNKSKKVEQILIRIIKQFEKRGSLNAVSTQTNLPFANREKEISDLKTEIKELKNENVSLISEIDKTKERLESILYVPQKESHQTLSNGTQTDEDNTLNDMRNHYEKIITILQKDNVLEKEVNEKQFKNILLKLTEAYEKDLTHKESLHNKELEKLRISQQEKCKDHINKYELQEAIQLETEKKKLHFEALLEKKQSLYDTELEKLKISQQEKCKDHINKFELEEAHRLEIEKQKSHYEALLKSKETEEDELNKEIKELKEEVGKIITEKQKDDISFNEKIKIQLINLKTKFKKHYKRLKKAHEVEVLQLNNKYNEAMKKINIENEARNNSKPTNVYCQTKLVNDIKQNADCQTEAFDEERLNNNLPPLFEQVDNFERTKESEENKESSDNNTSATNNKRFDINIRERIKCSFKEANGMIPKEIFNILNAMRPSTKILNSAFNLCMKDKTVPTAKQQTTVSEACGSLINSTNIMEGDCQETLKTLSMFEMCANKEKAIIEDMRDISNKRSNNYSSLHQGLNLEYERAEKLRNQRDELSDEVFRLKKQLANMEANLNFEKSKNENLNRLISSMKMQRRNSEKLEMSLERLRTKLERAEQVEKRLSEELQEDKKTSERIQVIIESNKIERKINSINAEEKNEVTQSQNDSEEGNPTKSSEVTRDVEEDIPNTECTDAIQPDNNFVKINSTTNNDLKMIFIQRCGVIHTWKEHLINSKII